MKNKKKYTAILLGLLVGAGGSAFADTIAVHSADTALLVGGSPAANFGGIMRLRHDNTADWGNEKAVEKFDIAAIQATLGVGESVVVNSARIGFWASRTGGSWDGAQTYPEITLHMNLSDWDGSTVTWATAPSLYIAANSSANTIGIIDFTANPLTSDGWLYFDDALTAAMVEGWVNGTIADYGVTVGVNGPVTDTTRLLDLQTADWGNELFVDYTIIPEPATLGLVGMVGAAMLVVRRKFMI